LEKDPIVGIYKGGANVNKHCDAWNADICHLHPAAQNTNLEP
jgi:hypothetical protein